MRTEHEGGIEEHPIVSFCIAPQYTCMLPYLLIRNVFIYNHGANKPLTHLILEEAEPNDWQYSVIAVMGGCLKLYSTRLMPMH